MVALSKLITDFTFVEVIVWKISFKAILNLNLCLSTEVSGQNFVEEDHRGKLSCEFIPKRLRRAADTTSKDQVMSMITSKRII